MSVDNPVDESPNTIPGTAMRVVDVDVPVSSLILLLIKLAVAAVPVGIILWIVWAILRELWAVIGFG